MINCEHCGAFVVDPARHNEWHRRTDRAKVREYVAEERDPMDGEVKDHPGLKSVWMVLVLPSRHTVAVFYPCSQHPEEDAEANARLCAELMNGRS